MAGRILRGDTFPPLTHFDWRAREHDFSNTLEARVREPANQNAQSKKIWRRRLKLKNHRHEVGGLQ